jgi:SAM-dependent methyltransferase
MTAQLQNYVDWKDWGDQDFGKFDPSHARYFEWHLSRALGDAAKPRVLEIGFGNGAFLGYCRQRSWDVAGIEIDDRLRDRASRAGFSVFESMKALKDDDRFDLIVLFDVLEHIPSDVLVDFLREISLRLSSGGTVLVRVPNGDSPFGRIHQHGDMTHVTTFGQSKIAQLAQLCELRVRATGESPWNAQQHEPPGIKSFCRAAIRRVTARVFGFAFFSYNVNLDSNMVAVLSRRD